MTNYKRNRRSNPGQKSHGNCESDRTSDAVGWQNCGMSDTDDAFLADHTYLSDGQPENLDERLKREVPDGEEAVPYERQPDAVGALVSEPDDDDPDDEPGEEQDIIARQEGKPRADASAEEAAMHLDEPEEVQEDWSAFASDADEDPLFDGDEPEDEDDEEPDRDDHAEELYFDAEADDD